MLAASIVHQRRQPRQPLRWQIFVLRQQHQISQSRRWCILVRQCCNSGCGALSSVETWSYPKLVMAMSKPSMDMSLFRGLVDKVGCFFARPCSAFANRYLLYLSRGHVSCLRATSGTASEISPALKRRSVCEEAHASQQPVDRRQFVDMKPFCNLILLAQINLRYYNPSSRSALDIPAYR
jgi:hypothetical protein